MNVNITDLIERSVNKLKSEYNLPNNGILTGGALSNTMFGILTDTDVKFDDIDIFILEKEVSLEERFKNKPKSNFTINSTTTIQMSDAIDYPSIILNSDYFLDIKKATQEGIINKIHCETNKINDFTFLEGFDLNCVKVCYRLETGESYWTKDFEKFLQTKKLKITNLNTPQHTIIRYLKKCEDLNLPIDKNELDMVYIFMLNNNSMIIRSFGEKLYEKFKKYSNILNRYFLIKENVSKNNLTYYNFILNKYPPIDYEKKIKPKEFRFNHKNFVEFYKEILGDPYLENLYKNLNIYIDQSIEYIDTRDALPYQIKMISELIQNQIILFNLSGLKLSQQIELVDKLFEQFYDNQLIAYSILVKIKFKRSDYNKEELLGLSYTTIRTIQQTSVNDRYERFKKLLNENT